VKAKRQREAPPPASAKKLTPAQRELVKHLGRLWLKQWRARRVGSPS
jgi:hypothetical protein